MKLNNFYVLVLLLVITGITSVAAQISNDTLIDYNLGIALTMSDV